MCNFIDYEVESASIGAPLLSPALQWSRDGWACSFAIPPARQSESALHSAPLVEKKGLGINEIPLLSRHCGHTSALAGTDK